MALDEQGMAAAAASRGRELPPDEIRWQKWYFKYSCGWQAAAAMAAEAAVAAATLFVSMLVPVQQLNDEIRLGTTRTRARRGGFRDREQMN